MSLPPPLTAITTPRTENSAFSFPKSVSATYIYLYIY